MTLVNYANGKVFHLEIRGTIGGKPGRRVLTHAVVVDSGTSVATRVVCNRAKPSAIEGKPWKPIERDDLSCVRCRQLTVGMTFGPAKG